MKKKESNYDAIMTSFSFLKGEGLIVKERERERKEDEKTNQHHGQEERG